MLPVLALVLLAISWPRPVPAASLCYAVIVSHAVPVQALTQDDLRYILTFKRTVWTTGQPISLLLPARHLPARHFLLTRVYRMSDAELRHYTLERLIQADIDFAPKVVSSDEDAIAFAAAGTAVIAVVSAATELPPTVRVVRIDGRLPGDTGYPLQ
jgi:hypothetical protein